MADIESELTKKSPEVPVPDYELTQEDAIASTEELVEELASSAEFDPTMPFLLTEVKANSKYANLGRLVEKQVFVKEFGNDSEEMSKEYGPYENNSIFWIVIDTSKRQPIGALRVIANSETGLKTLNDIAKPETLGLDPVTVIENTSIDPEKTWDVGTVAVLEEYRGFEHAFVPSLALYHALYGRAENYGIEHYVSIIDKSAMNNLSLLGVRLEPIMGSGPFKYLGSDESWALFNHRIDMYKAFQDRIDEIEAKHTNGKPIGGIDELVISSIRQLMGDPSLVNNPLDKLSIYAKHK